MANLWKCTQEQLKKLWACLEDVPVSEDETYSLVLQEKFLDYPIGTDVIEIWHDFDEVADGGVKSLMYDGWDWNRVLYVSNEEYEAIVKMLEEDGAGSS